MKKKPGPIPSRLPRRYKKRGKSVGSYYLRINGQDVNLRTEDAAEALERAKEARKGKRDFVKADGGARAAAVAVDEGLTGTGAATTAPVVESPPVAAPELTPAASPPPAAPQAHTPVAALPPLPGTPPNATSSPGPGVRPDGYIPPPTGWADFVRGAASSTEAAAAEADEPLEDVLTPDDVDDFVDQLAEGLVNGQIALQEWAGRKGWIAMGLKIKTGEVPTEGPGARGRIVGKKIWKRAVKKLIARYMPDLDIPDWLTAPALVLSLTLPVQLANAELIPDDAKPEETPTAAEPAAA